MTCPNCNSENVEMVSKKDDGQGFYEEEYYAYSDCGCEYKWEMTKTIIVKGKEVADDGAI